MRRSSGMRVRVEGVDEILKALQKADDDLKKELHDLISEAAVVVFKRADADIPIKSGAARSSLKIETGFTNNGAFYANVTVGGDFTYYITFYELGSSRQPARPFLRPALDKSKNEIRQLMISGLQSAIARQGK